MHGRDYKQLDSSWTLNLPDVKDVQTCRLSFWHLQGTHVAGATPFEPISRVLSLVLVLVPLSEEFACQAPPQRRIKQLEVGLEVEIKVAIGWRED